MEKDSGYFNFINVIRDFSAVTGACLLVKKSVFTKIGGFDDNFDLYYGDSDLCLRIRHLGYHVVYTPYAKLLHEGSSSIREHGDAFFTVENHYNFIKISIIYFLSPTEIYNKQSISYDKKIAYKKGFLMVSASPLTRSSYHASEDFIKLKKARELSLSIN